MDENELLTRLLNGKVPLHKLEEDTTPETAARIRRRFIENKTGAKLSAINNSRLEFDKVYNKNAENVIGSISIPLGVAGPIKINGELATGEFYVPMATTEGALIASTSRGMKGITMSGGATVSLINEGMARAPVFEFESAAKAVEFTRWIEKNTKEITSVAEKTTKHGKIKSISNFVVGNNVWVRFAFDTGDAMGMNMVTIATEAACEYMEKNFTGAILVAVSGNMCSDKKESYVNELLGRGRSVVADCIVEKDILDKVFGVSAEQINKVNLKKNLLGSSRAGSSKHNAHFANIIAAIFAATGQDIAQVVESSSGYTWTEVRKGALYISVTLPSLEIGTIGGGTTLAEQKEALSIMGVSGASRISGENSRKFAEIIAAAVLAGELNLLCAISKRELGKAHSKLGRGK